jgi:hypothetical protein
VGLARLGAYDGLVPFTVSESIVSWTPLEPGTGWVSFP